MKLLTRYWAAADLLICCKCRRIIKLRCSVADAVTCLCPPHKDVVGFTLTEMEWDDA